MILSGIMVKEENGVFRVPADFKEGFVLVPEPKGRLNLTFWDKKRMQRFLRTYGFKPFINPGIERFDK